MTTLQKYRNILIITGEVSGDMQAGYMLKALKQRDPSLKVYAVGSDNLQAAGAEIVKDLTKKSTIGFLEAIKHVPSLLLLKNKLVKFLDEKKIDLLICVDYQGFNMIMAAEARKRKIHVVYYIPPQEWVWGSDKGMQKVVNIVDKVVTIFKAEFDCYKKFTSQAGYFGHPLVQVIENYFKENKKIKPAGTCQVAVFPGSRKQEIKYIFPEMIKIMSYMAEMDKNIKFVINLPNAHYQEEIEQGIKAIKQDIPVLIGKNYQVLKESKFALITSGTICLEASIIGIPHVVLYKFGNLSYKIIRRVLAKKFKFKHYSLTNIVAGKEVVKEYLQHINAKEVGDFILDNLQDKDKLEVIKNELKSIKEKLQIEGKTNILESIAEYILEPNGYCAPR
ncbi:MAG: lipid-A-disaccharide synthase [Candidatus Margulisbacteria bacterium]|nr:lipid-A-disaccharide synthase [Candidatus Margulisiibacteriota bacterium]